MHCFRTHSAPWWSLALLALLFAPALTVLAAGSQADEVVAAESRSASPTTRGYLAIIPPQVVPTLPTAEQLALIATLPAHPAPDWPVFEGPLSGPANLPVRRTVDPITSAEQAASPADPAVFRSNLVPFLGLRSGVGEPSVDGSGKMTFLTGNWYAARSSDNGSSWAYVNPFADFGAGHTSFCCDQLTVYDASHDRQFWLRQYVDGHLEISNSAGTSLSSWCTYDWMPDHFGLPANYQLDYNHMGLSTDYLYVSSNVYSTNGFEGVVVFRVSLEEQANCASSPYQYFGLRDTEASVAFVNGAGDTMYFGSNWVTGAGLSPGTGFRVFRWPDDSNLVEIFHKIVHAYAFMVSGGSQDCGSANGTVLNWCERTDSRLTGNGYVSFPSLAQQPLGYPAPDNHAVIGFAFNANQDGSHPRPYIRRIYFRTRDIAYLGRSELWNPQIAMLYPDMASNGRGHVGMIWAWGGGDGANAYYPGYGFTIDDDVSQTQPWYSSFYAAGQGNACLNTSDSRRRWGDYLSIHALNPAKLVWIASGFRMSSATNCVSGSSVPQEEVRTIVFGRERDRRAYLRGSGS